jgi:hypothetical protein
LVNKLVLIWVNLSVKSGKTAVTGAKAGCITVCIANDKEINS